LGLPIEPLALFELRNVAALASGACVIEVNPEPTPFSRLVDLRIGAPAGEAVPRLTEEIERCLTPG